EIAEGLNGRGARTPSGKLWGGQAVRMLMGSRYHAGVRVFRGEPVGRGVWPVVFDTPTWEELGRARAFRASTWKAARPSPPRFFLLRGLVVCRRCGVRMIGGRGRDRALYRCSRTHRVDEGKCTRTIQAE